MLSCLQCQAAASIHSRLISDGEMVGVGREILQESYSNFGLSNFIHRRVAQAKTLPKVRILEILFTYVCLGYPLEKFVVSTF